MIEFLLGTLILIVGLFLQISFSEIGVAHCKGITNAPLLLLNGAILVLITYIIRGSFKVKIIRFAYVAILAGGIGNILDELLHKCISDYFNLLGVYFNFFDLSICLGLIILAFTYTTKKVK